MSKQAKLVIINENFTQNMALSKKLSVIIPAYNEEKRIAGTLDSVDSYLKKQDYDYEIIVIDNDSNDGTFNLVKDLAGGKMANLRIVKAHEKGKGGAVAFGVNTQATAEYIMFMDADNATPISEIEKFWPYFNQGYSVVIGSRYLEGSNVTRKQPFYRIALSRMANMLIQFLTVPGIKDTQLGFKVFTRQAAKDIFSHVTIFRWGFDMEVLTIARQHEYKIKELPVLWREQGGSHVPLKAYIESLIDLFKIKLNVLLDRYKK